MYIVPYFDVALRKMTVNMNLSSKIRSLGAFNVVRFWNWSVIYQPLCYKQNVYYCSQFACKWICSDTQLVKMFSHEKSMPVNIQFKGT